MKDIPNKSVDMIFTDLPYGTTHCKWDSIIPLDELWMHYKRIIKDNGAILLFAQTPFDKVLGSSNLQMLKYEWIWEKTQATGHLHPTQKPLALCEYMVKTYTNEGDLVVDSCMGSNTTGLACKNLKRRYIGIEKDVDIFRIAKERIEEVG